MSTTVTLTNNKGETHTLRANLTIKELVAMGYKDVLLVPTATPLPDGVWVMQPTPKPAVTELIDG